LVAVAFSGQSCDMRKIAELAERYNFIVIEDASHAVGASYYAGRPVGCGQFAAMTVFSFHPVKIITSAEGGMVLDQSPGAGRAPATPALPRHDPRSAADERAEPRSVVLRADRAGLQLPDHRSAGCVGSGRS
jgi:hypothetical protein